MIEEMARVEQFRIEKIRREERLRIAEMERDKKKSAYELYKESLDLKKAWDFDAAAVKLDRALKVLPADSSIFS